ncbi:TetR/AcrR family transcriptional regulator [Clostridiaceae bacterium]|nr:TetR/AcrR family transcriptional regulator [Clostridiaceae bacterium]RKI13404.1 TetR/AcrR family transcriptional regulator [bacterium 1XD21-70]
MPTERFNRLPEAKKQAIREAALKEFARVPFDKASINQIIRNADISRGSFYTYFVDKQDVVKFLLKDTFEQMEDICKKELHRNGGDYFAMVEMMFEYFVGELRQNPDMVMVARNIFSNKENNELVGIERWPSPDCAVMPGSPARWMYENLDRSRFRFETMEEFFPLAVLAMSSLAVSLKQYYEYPKQLENIRETFYKSLDILKYGAYKREEP